MATIELKQTYEGLARTSAYLLAGHSQARPEDYLGGTYWEASELAHQRAIGTWNAVCEVVEVLEKVGVDFYSQTKTFKTRVIKSAFAKVCAELKEAQPRPEGWEN